MKEKLPEGWVEEDLKNVTYFQEGPGLRKWQFSATGIPFLNIKTLENEQINKDKCKFIDKEEFEKKYKHFSLNEGDIVISSSGTLGKIAIVRKRDLPIILNTSIIRFRSTNENILLQLYLKFFLKSDHYFSQIAKHKTGSAILNYGPSHLKKMKIFLPPLSEQNRIASRLDKLMPRIEAVRDRLSGIPGLIKRFRQSVLNAAVTGKLTEKWREEHPEVESAGGSLSFVKSKDSLSKKEYLSSWRNFTFPNKWSVAYLKDVADVRLGKMLDKSKNKGKTVKYLRNLNVRWLGFDLNDISTLLAQDEEIDKLSIQNGDVLICEGGEPGRAATWKAGKNDYVFQKALHRARVLDCIEPDWLVYNIKRDADTKKLNDLFTGTTIKHLTGRSLGRYPLVIPPLEEQKEIVRQVDRLFSFADKLERHYQKAKDKLDKLPQAVLAKAFRGELVPTEAELARKQGRDYETAQQLLERIKIEKNRLEQELKKNKT